MNRYLNRWMPASCLLLVFAFLCLYGAWTVGQTTDETFFAGSGYPMVRYNNYEILGEHPPLMIQLGALPLLFLQPKYPIDEPILIPETGGFDISKMGAKFLYQMGNNPRLILFLSRVPIVLVGALLGLVLYQWAHELFGFWGAFFSLSLFVFCPNVISNSSLYTTDLGVTAFMFLTLHRAKKLLEVPSVKNAVWTGIGAGLAFLSKMSALSLPAIVFCILLADYARGGPERIARFVATADPRQKRRLDLLLLLLSFVLFVLALSEKTVAVFLGPLCILCLNSISSPEGGVKRLWEILCLVLCIGVVIACFIFLVAIAQKRGITLTAIAASWLVLALGIAGWLRAKKEAGLMHLIKIFCLVWFVSLFVIIFAYTDFLHSLSRFSPFHHYTRSFHIALSHAMTDHKICVPGSFVTCDWKYFMTTMLIKTPLVTLVFLIFGAVYVILAKVGKLDKASLFIPPLIFLAFASFLNRINIGLRHVLPIYPFIFLIAGGSVCAISKMSSGVTKKMLAVFPAIGIGYLAWTNFMLLPNQLTYFNEFVGSTERGAELVGGSNLNWGQDIAASIRFLKQLNVSSVRVANTAHNPDEYRYHHLKWEPVPPEEFIHPKPGYYVLDVLYYVPEQKKEESWFKNRKPDYKIGETLYIFKVPA